VEAVTPVFIGGAGRSGTTLVVDMLGLHPDLSPVYETDFVMGLTQILFGDQQEPVENKADKTRKYMDTWTKPLPHPPHNKREHERYHHGAHYILFDRPFAMQQTEVLVQRLSAGQQVEGFREFIGQLFAEHCRLDGKPRWINKTLAYVSMLPALKGLFPQMKFIQCIRDGRDVAASVITRPWGPNNVRDAAPWWLKIIERGQQFGALVPEQYLEVRYEDLVREPEATLGTILRWLGEAAVEGEVVRQHLAGTIPLDPGRLGVWKQALSIEDQQYFLEAAGTLLDRLGYDST